jgi:hypothetical protein
MYIEMHFCCMWRVLFISLWTNNTFLVHCCPEEFKRNANNPDFCSQKMCYVMLVFLIQSLWSFALKLEISESPNKNIGMKKSSNFEKWKNKNAKLCKKKSTRICIPRKEIVCSTNKFVFGRNDRSNWPECLNFLHQLGSSIVTTDQQHNKTVQIRIIYTEKRNQTTRYIQNNIVTGDLNSCIESWRIIDLSQKWDIL